MVGQHDNTHVNNTSNKDEPLCPRWHFSIKRGQLAQPTFGRCSVTVWTSWKQQRPCGGEFSSCCCPHSLVFTAPATLLGCHRVLTVWYCVSLSLVNCLHFVPVYWRFYPMFLRLWSTAFVSVYWLFDPVFHCRWLTAFNSYLFIDGLILCFIVFDWLHLIHTMSAWSAFVMLFLYFGYGHPLSSPRAHCTPNKSVPTLQALTECSPLDFRRSSISPPATHNAKWIRKLIWIFFSLILFIWQV